MRLIDADEVIRKVNQTLNKGVYKTMIIELVRNAPSIENGTVKISSDVPDDAMGEFKKIIDEYFLKRENSAVNSEAFLIAFSHFAEGLEVGSEAFDLYKENIRTNLFLALIALGYVIKLDYCRESSKFCSFIEGLEFKPNIRNWFMTL